ncbi:hypothetical protein CVT24_009343 [Panaeolus cyanescens]|uniref:Mitochondrial import protein 1 n=1 Tax=Panaeolus cyanescens TaxID=181874 RepID=A0A409Y8E0_9AGAR|nr:hypothetical protein CVT24_009343 [Panaeolus cyanescens]
MSSANEYAADPLESAFDSAFVAPPVRRQSLKEDTASPSTPAEKSGESSKPIISATESSTDSNPASLDDSWKEEYESQVQAWRAQSAEAREKAEQERLKWEAKRAIEKEEAAKRKAAGILDEPAVEPWDKPSAGTGSSTGKQEKEATANPVPAPSSEQETLTEGSQKWEEVQSMTSSFPSMTFPENIDTPPPALQQPKSTTEPPASATLAVFDSSLSTRTRAVAFFSSLAVNLLLPFVNGVMLGFGEIFAKNVVMGWLGWSPAPATSVGLRTTRKEERRSLNPFSR